MAVGFDSGGTRGECPGGSGARQQLEDDRAVDVRHDAEAENAHLRCQGRSLRVETQQEIRLSHPLGSLEICRCRVCAGPSPYPPRVRVWWVHLGDGPAGEGVNVPKETRLGDLLCEGGAVHALERDVHADAGEDEEAQERAWWWHGSAGPCYESSGRSVGCRAWMGPAPIFLGSWLLKKSCTTSEPWLPRFGRPPWDIWRAVVGPHCAEEGGGGERSVSCRGECAGS